MKMKKVVCSLLAAVMASTMLFPMTAFAAEADTSEEDNDVYQIQEIQMTREEFEQLEYVEGENNMLPGGITPYSTGLITSTRLDIARGGTSSIIIYTTTGCASTVTKCGFTEIKLQRRKTSSDKWDTSFTYSDQYVNTNYFNNVYQITVANNYQYRVEATHYAYKNWLSTQKIKNTTSYLVY